MPQNSKTKRTLTPLRKNVTVLFADIVGYTRMMEKHEADALNKLNYFKEKLEQRIAPNSGELIQYYGDAALAIFNTPEEAMKCALLLQKDSQISTHQVPLRIGIHIGEVVFKNDNVFGDTVNVASRLENMGVSGSVLCSERVKDTIGENAFFQFKDIGEFTLKNVSEPIKVFALSNDACVIPTKNEIERKIAQPVSITNRPIFKWTIAGMLVVLLLAIGFFINNQQTNNNTITNQTKKEIDKSIAVLPFANLSSDKDNQYFCDGVMEDILNRLSSVNDLRVMSRTSVLRYRDSDQPIIEIAKELGVSHILEGSIRRFENKIRVIVKLVQAETEIQVWSESYDRVIDDIFGIQAEIAEHIGKNLEVTFLPKESKLVDYQPTESTDAYDLFLKGRGRMHVYQEHRRENDLDLAYQYFSSALQLDDQLAIAWAYLGEINILRHTYFGAPSGVIDTANIYLEKAITLHPQLPEGYLFRSKCYELKKQLPKMEADLKQALALSPNSGDILRNLGSFYVTETDDLEKGIPYYKKAITLEPFNVRPLISLSNLHKLVGNLEESKNYLDRATQIEPDRLSNYMRLAELLMLFNDFPQAQKYAQRIFEINPDFIWGNHILGETYAFDGKYLAAEPYYREIQKIVSQKDFIESFGTPPFRHRLGFVLWHTDRKEEANTLFQQMIDKNLKIVNSDIDNLGGARYDLAAVHAFLGENDKAIEWMNRIFKDGSWFDFYYTQIDPMFDPIRNDERFQAIINREKARIEKMKKKVNQMESVQFF